MAGILKDIREFEKTLSTPALWSYFSPPFANVSLIWYPSPPTALVFKIRRQFPAKDFFFTFSWPYCPGMIYGSVYLYERLTWTNQAKLRVFKQQYVDHAARKLRWVHGVHPVHIRVKLCVLMPQYVDHAARKLRWVHGVHPVHNRVKLCVLMPQYVDHAARKLRWVHGVHPVHNRVKLCVLMQQYSMWIMQLENSCGFMVFILYIRVSSYMCSAHAAVCGSCS
jgi:hypothetical protein